MESSQREGVKGYKKCTKILTVKQILIAVPSNWCWMSILSGRTAHIIPNSTKCQTFRMQNMRILCMSVRSTHFWQYILGSKDDCIVLYIPAEWLHPHCLPCCIHSIVIGQFMKLRWQPSLAFSLRYFCSSQVKVTSKGEC